VFYNWLWRTLVFAVAHFAVFGGTLPTSYGAPLLFFACFNVPLFSLFCRKPMPGESTC
jgi:hypothetical protein